MIQPATSGLSSNKDDFRRIFIIRVHQLLQLGYNRMQLAQYTSQEETVITGDLRVAIDSVIDDPNSEEWVHFFHIEDEHHVSDGKNKGKKRNRVDIRLTASHPRPRNHFSFEAKRLGKNKPVIHYLGKKGLGCFIRADYAAEDAEAGMIAYVQSPTVENWIQKVSSVLAMKNRAYQVSDDHHWREQSIPGGPQRVFKSRHHRRKLKNTIDIFHTFLVFFC